MHTALLLTILACSSQDGVELAWNAKRGETYRLKVKQTYQKKELDVSTRGWVLREDWKYTFEFDFTIGKIAPTEVTGTILIRKSRISGKRIPGGVKASAKLEKKRFPGKIVRTPPGNRISFGRLHIETDAAKEWARFVARRVPNTELGFFLEPPSGRHKAGARWGDGWTLDKASSGRTARGSYRLKKTHEVGRPNDWNRDWKASVEFDLKNGHTSKVTLTALDRSFVIGQERGSERSTLTLSISRPK